MSTLLRHVWQAMAGQLYVVPDAVAGTRRCGSLVSRGSCGRAGVTCARVAYVRPSSNIQAVGWPGNEMADALTTVA